MPDVSRTRMVWRWSTNGLVHVVDRVVFRRAGGIDVVDHALGCGIRLGTPDVPKSLRLHAPVTCLRCTVAPINTDVIDGE